MELTYTKHGDYYLRKNKDDLDDRLYRMYDKIDDLEQSLIEARAKKQSIEAEKMTGDNIYCLLVIFEYKGNALLTNLGRSTP